MPIKYSIPSTQFIKQVGIELEGGWRRARGIRPYADGSVHVGEYDEQDEREYREDDDDTPVDEQGRRMLIGEINCPPLAAPQAIEWLLENYPNVVNDSCGLHVHVSFVSKLRYQQIMDKVFWNYFRNTYTEWAKKRIISKEFWRRWNGENRFCMPEWHPDDQVLRREKGGRRYTTLNFCYSVEDPGGPRKTVEFRALPMFKSKEVAAAAICKYLETIEAYLATRVSERPFEVEIEDDEYAANGQLYVPEEEVQACVLSL